jgi:hypothetical protein
MVDFGLWLFYRGRDEEKADRRSRQNYDIKPRQVAIFLWYKLHFYPTVTASGAS